MTCDRTAETSDVPSTIPNKATDRLQNLDNGAQNANFSSLLELVVEEF
jgi:hypothetical protein